MILAAIAAAALFLQMVITMALSRKRRRRRDMPSEAVASDMVGPEVWAEVLDLLWNGKT